MKTRKHMRGRALALLLSLAMCLGTFQMPVFASEATEPAATEVSVASEVTAKEAEAKPAESEAAPEEPEAAPEEPEAAPEESVAAPEESTPSTEESVVTPGESVETPVEIAGTSEEAAETVKETTEVTEESITVPEETTEVSEEPTTVSEEPVYASIDEFMAAVEAIGNAGDYDSTMAALDEIDAIYAALSPEDQKAMAEQYQAVQAYRKNPNEGVNELVYVTYTSHITLYPSGAAPTGTKMRVGDHYSGHWYVEEISTSHVMFGSQYGEHNNSFPIPAPSSIWDGVTHSYKTVCSGSAFSNKPSVGSNGQVLFTGGSATYSNLQSTGGGDQGGTTPSDISFTVVHEYYTNETFDGRYEETQSFPSLTYNGSILVSDLTKKTEYKLNTYSYESATPSSIYVKKGATGNQGTFTLTYKRSVTNYTYHLTWNYNGGNANGITDNQESEEATENSKHTFYEDAVPKPEKDGYTFDGWAYSGNGTFTKSNGQINMNGVANSTVYGTLTAQWKQNAPVAPVATNRGTVVKIFKGLEEIPEDFSITWTATSRNNSAYSKSVVLDFDNVTDIQEDLDTNTVTATWSSLGPVYHNAENNGNGGTVVTVVENNYDVNGYTCTTTASNGCSVNGHTITRTVPSTVSPRLTVTNTYDEVPVPTPHTVKYEWTGLPDEANEILPETKSYEAGEEVTVDTKYTSTSTVTVNDETYTFSGWNTEDAQIQDGKFSMPDHDVTIHGTWTKTAIPSTPMELQARYLVQWMNKDGEPLKKQEVRGPKPVGTEVAVTEGDKDSITKDGSTYIFDPDDDRNILKGTLSKDNVVILKLYFEKESYHVTYTWTGLPADANELLPKGGTYEKDASVTVDSQYTNGKEVTVGDKTYTFSGWHTEDAAITDDVFTMPGKDVVISGTWTEKTETGTDPDPNPGTDPDPNPGTDPDPNPGTDPDPNPGTDPDPNPGTDPDPNPGTDPTPDPGTASTPDSGTDPLPVPPAIPTPALDLEFGPTQIDILDPVVPLANRPDWGPIAEPVEESVEIIDEEVPLADVPKTGDDSRNWIIFTLLSGLALVWMKLSGNKNKKQAD